MLQIKLSRIGKKKMPTYRLVILEKGRDPYGNTLEILGNYNPRTKKGEYKIERIKYWLEKGAQTTDTVNNLLLANKIIEGKSKKSYTINKKRAVKLDAKKEEEEKVKAKKAAEEVKKEVPAEEVKEIAPVAEPAAALQE